MEFCLIRLFIRSGYYVQINSEEEARRRVIEYALVMARPMVLYQADHPIHWSHVFVGGLSRLNSGKIAQRLFTTVSTPVYDRRNTSVREANLLGVVGTDVPIEDIKKMVPQYKVSSELEIVGWNNLMGFRFSFFSLELTGTHLS